MFIIFNQKKTNEILFNEIKKAKKFIIIHTMFFDDTKLDLNFVELLNSKIAEFPNIYIEIKIGLNPFIVPNICNLDKKIKIILENPRTIFLYVYHIRLFHTENVFAVGGIDISDQNLYDSYNQYTLFLNDPKYFIMNEDNCKKYQIKNLHDFVGTSTDSYTKMIECINNAKHEIFIDNQFFSLNHLEEILIEKKKKTNINIYLLVNSSNTVQKLNEFETFTVNLMSFFSLKYINNLKKNGIKFIKTNKFTHNKLCIIDKQYLLMGSMNLMERSINNDGDIEMCVFLENKEICNNLLAYYQEIFSYETI